MEWPCLVRLPLAPIACHLEVSPKLLIWRVKTVNKLIFSELSSIHFYQKSGHQNSMVLAQKQKYRSVKQEESPEINPDTYGLLTCDKEGKTI